MLRVFAFLLVVGVAFRAALPLVAAYVLEDVLSGGLVAKVEIGDVDLNVREGLVVMRDWRLRTVEGVPLARSRSTGIDLAWGPLLRGRLVAQKLVVEDPEVFLTLDADGHFNWADLGEEPDGEEPADERDDDDPAFRVVVERAELGEGVVSLRDDGEDGLPDVRLLLGRFAFDDLVLERAEPGAPLSWGLGGADASEWRLGIAPGGEQTVDLGVAARTGTVGPDGWVPLELEVAQAGGVDFAFAGRLQPSPFELEGGLRWSGLSSRAAAPLLGAVDFEVESGTSRGRLDIELTLDDTPDRGFNVVGETFHDDLVMRTHDGGTELGVVHFESHLKKLSVPLPTAPLEPPEPIRADWSRIRIVEPTLALTLDEEPAAEEELEQGDEGFHIVLRTERFSLERGKVLLRGRDLLDYQNLFPPDGPSADAVPEIRLEIAGIAFENLHLEPGGGQDLRWSVGSSHADDWRIGIWRGEEQGLALGLSVRAGAAERGGWIPVEIDGRREGGVKLDFEGQLRPYPVGVDGRLEWRRLDSRALAPLVGLADVRVDRGRSSGGVEVGLDLSDAPERGLRARGSVSHSDLELETADGLVKLRMPHFEGDIARLRIPLPEIDPEPPEPVVVEWTRVAIRDPHLDFTFPRELDAPDAPPPGVTLRADRLSLANGTLVLQDEVLPGFSQTLTGIRVDASGVDWPANHFEKATVTGGGLGTEPFRIAGYWTREQGQIDVRATRVQLPPWNPVIQYYTDYIVTRGNMSLESRFRIRGNVYEAPTRVTLRGIQARAKGDSFRRRYGMSIESAIPLLTDTSGSINLEFVIRGDVSKGAPDLGPAFQTAFRAGLGNALANTAAVPVDVTAAVIRRVGEAFMLGVGEATFPAGAAELRSDARAVTLSAAKMFARRGGGTLELVPRIVSDDLRALGIDPGGDGVVGSIVATGRALFGGGRRAAEGERAEAYALSKQRTDSLIRYLVEEGRIPRSQIRAARWDGNVREGVPRVLLRIRGGE